jgi:PAS domain S-box-containing protein
MVTPGWAAQPLTRVSLQLRWLHQFQFAGYYAAIERGYYRDAGLDVWLIDFSFGLDVVEEVLSGRADFGIASAELLLHRLQGKPVTVLAPIFQHSPLALLAHPEAGIKDLRDLAGKRVQLSRSPRDIEVHAMLHRAGVALNSLDIIETRVHPEELSPTSSAALSIYVTDQLYHFETNKIPALVFHPASYGVDCYSDCLFTTERTAADRPSVAAAFRDASLRGWEYALNNPDELIDLIKIKYKSKRSREHLKFEASKTRTLIAPDVVEIGHVNPERWKRLAALFVECGFVPNAASLDGFLFQQKAIPTNTPLYWLLATSLCLAVAGWAGAALLFSHNKRLREKMRSGKKTEAALREGYTLFKAFFDNAATGMAQLDTNGTAIKINRALSVLLGYLPEDIEGRPGREFTHPDDIAPSSRVLREFLNAEEQAISFEKRYIHKSGAVIWASLRIAKILDSIGEPLFFLAIVTDISERKRVEHDLRRAREELETRVSERTQALTREVQDRILAEETLRSSESRFRAIFEQAAVGISQCDLNGVVNRVNAEYASMLNVSPEELLGRSMLDFIHPDDVLPAVDRVKRLLAGELLTFAMELRRQRKDGLVIWTMLTVSLVRDEDEAPDYFLAFTLDITERKVIESQLRVAQFAMDNASDMVFWISDSGRFVYVNDAAVRSLGYSREELLKQTAYSINPEFTLASYLAIWEQLKEKKAIRFQSQVKRIDGDLLPVEVSANYLQLEGREYNIAYLRDITAQQLLLKELLAAKTAAEDASRAKSDFLAKMSHEIRTPLNAVMGMAELIAQSEIAPEPLGYAHTIKLAAGNLLSIINDILDISKIEARKLEIETIAFDLTQLLESTIATLAIQAKNKRLQLELAIAPKTPRLLYGDPGRIRQILVNLIGNALKFTEKGGVNVAVAPGMGLENKAFPLSLQDGVSLLLFSVTDTGLGIPTHLHDTIFDIFKQADASTTRRFGGAGLGLALTRELVDLMGGAIWLESQPGKGSVFQFVLPFKLADSSQITLPAEPKPPKSNRPLRTLLVEDNEENRTITLKFLQKLGHVAFAAVSGRQALEMLALDPYDVVLMDVEMPGMDGLETTRRLRAGEAGPANAKVRVLALTAHAISTYKQRCLDEGMDGFLPKPISFQDLADALGAHQAAPPPDRDIQTAPPAAQTFNKQAALQRFNHDVEMFIDSCASFVEISPLRLHDLQQELDADNFQELKLKAHSFKSVCGIVGAESCQQLCAELENAAREQDAQTARSALLSLGEALDLALSALRAYVPRPFAEDEQRKP